MSGDGDAIETTTTEPADDSGAESAATTGGDSNAASPTPSLPWAEDLQGIFTDPAIAGQVDGFLREKVQPYVTKLEQESIGNRNANRLWDDFTNKPVDTFISVTEEMFGQEQAKAVRDLLAGETGDTVEASTEVNEDALDLDELPASVREAVEFYQSNRNQENWNGLIERLRKDNPDLTIDDTIFAPFVNAADGDVNLALNGYKEWVTKAKETFGIEIPKPEDVTVPGGETTTAPPTIGSEQQSTTAPPQQSRPATIDGAIDELFSEMQAAKNAPEVIGAT